MPRELLPSINRVVEHTIEKVTSVQSGNTSVKEVTVVVKQEDFVADSIDKVSKSIARIKTVNEEGKDVTVGLGLVLHKDGFIATDSHVAPSVKLHATFADGRNATITRAAYDPDLGVSLWRTTDHSGAIAVELGNSDSVKLGQTVLELGGTEETIIGSGIVTNLVQKSVQSADASSTVEVQTLDAIETNIPAKSPIGGTPLISVTGQVLGFKVKIEDMTTRYSFIPINLLRAYLADTLAKPAATSTAEAATPAILTSQF
ncbi:serine protease [Candidatus Parcubacteria bacterium]|nr:serine protease [Candidatus Parcubacteria bacterium]